MAKCGRRIERRNVALRWDKRHLVVLISGGQKKRAGFLSLPFFKSNYIGTRHFVHTQSDQFYVEHTSIVSVG